MRYKFEFQAKSGYYLKSIKNLQNSMDSSATMKFPGLSSIEKELNEKHSCKASIRIFSKEGFDNTVKKQAYTTGN